ncbi:MAG TPA: universal stress protein [Ideonella sp.]|nr:universal stress protein [Ideonella sp.]
MHYRILVPLDGSASAEFGLQEAIALAARERARLCLLHVLDPDNPAAGGGTDRARRRWGEELLSRARRTANEAGVPADTSLRGGRGDDIAHAICDEADSAGCDLIVLGAHGQRRRDRHALGENVQTVLDGARVPVLLVREEGL